MDKFPDAAIKARDQAADMHPRLFSLRILIRISKPEIGQFKKNSSPTSHGPSDRDVALGEVVGR